MVFAVLAAVAAIGALTGWIVVTRLPRSSGRSRFDRIFLGTIIAFGTVLALNMVWFIAGCIVRVPGALRCVRKRRMYTSPKTSSPGRHAVARPGDPSYPPPR